MAMESVNALAQLSGINLLFIAAAVIWTFIWKGLALWKAASLRHKPWFIALLIVNSLGILEIIYLFFVAKKYRVEIVEETK